MEDEEQYPDVGDHQPQVLVLGAGMAGLTAARALLERGVRVVVVEARNRVGGRVCTETVDGVAVELGAEFVHGRAPELMALIEEAGLTAVEREGTNLSVDDGGGLAEDDARDEDMFATLGKLNGGGHDEPFAAWLAKQEVSGDEREALLGFVEGFNAADAGRIGTHALAAQQAAEDAIEGDRAWHVAGGYTQLAEFLAAEVRALGGVIALGKTVEHLEWQPQSVTLSCVGDEEAFHGERCIVTLPLGVLQSSTAVQFHPEPPALDQARRLAMGRVVRFTLLFRSRWWMRSTAAVSAEALRSMSFLFTLGNVPSVWWTQQPEDANAENRPVALVGWSGGPRSDALAGKTAHQLGIDACRQLAQVFEMDVLEVQAQLLSTHVHDWSGDPLTLGAYSYVPAGALGAPRAMTLPEFDTLYFAGEHTDITGHWGTVHAAIRSGLRAAAQVLGEWSG